MFRVLSSLAVAALFLLAIPGAWAKTHGEAPTEVKGATIVDAAMAKTLWDKGASFVDVRTPDLWEQGRIPGATFLDLLTDYNETNLAKVAMTSDKVVIYCMGPG